MPSSTDPTPPLSQQANSILAAIRAAGGRPADEAVGSMREGFARMARLFVEPEGLTAVPVEIRHGASRATAEWVVPAGAGLAASPGRRKAAHRAAHFQPPP